MRSLVRPSVDPVVALGAALAAAGLWLVAPWELVVATGLLVALALPHLGSRARRVALALLVAGALAAGAWRGRAREERHGVARDEARAALGLPKLCAAHAVVASSPVRAHDVLRWDAELSGVSCEGAPVAWTGRATLYGGPADLARGDEADVVATLGEPQRLWNFASGDPRPGEARRGVTRSGGTADVVRVRRASGLLAWIDRARAHVRARIDATFVEADLGAMARALVLGESDLAAEDDASLRASGLSHLLAVSGMHLVLVLAVVVRVLRGVLARVPAVAARWDAGALAAAVGVPAAWLYAELAGAGGSTLRAAWMATAALVARALGRRTDGPRAFGLSLLAMGIVDPLVAFDLSFVLSAAATAGLLAFAAPLSSWLVARVPSRLGWLASPARAAGTTLAATIPCTPVLARFAPTVPLGGVLANLLAVPVGELAALPLCLLHALLGPWPSAQAGCAAVASGALRLVRLVARWFSVPALTAEVPQPSSWQMVFLAVALGAVVLGGRRRRVALAASLGAVVLLEGMLRASGAPTGVLRVTFLDVGQGDGALVDLPDGSALVIDGGGLVGSPIDVGERVVAPALRARRRAELAIVVLSHPHPDHFGGLATGLGAVRVGELWDSGQGEAEGTGGGYAHLLADRRARGTRVVRPGALCGTRVVGGVTIDVLAPCPGPSPDLGPNDNSIVVRLTYGRRSLLFVGDAEHEAERTLLAHHGADLHADVLKVGHHGSRTSSSPELLRAVAPREAIISVGGRNRFGHPSPVTLASLAVAGARVWRTDVDGAVVVTTDGERLDVTSARAEEGRR